MWSVSARAAVFGPVADRFGRRGPLLFGFGVYVIAAILAAFASEFWALLALRFIQGVGAAATRVIAVSVVRDTFGGRQMAEVMSLVMMVFMVVPVIAPGAGQVLLLIATWEWIFIFMGLMAAAIAVWALARLPETLAVENRRPFTMVSILEAFAIVLTNRVAFCYALASAVLFGAIFGFINSAQQVYVGIYELGAWFPVLFAVVAGMMALSSFLNSRLVGRLGMRRLSHFALLGFLAANGLWLLWALTGPVPLVPFMIVFTAALFLFGWILPNFNALAMEPLGHVAGTASSVIGFAQTFIGGVLGAGIGYAFDGTLVPLALGFFLSALLALVFVLVAENGRLFRVVSEPPRD
jgi:MFS transporter, DHA1 family, multidrug resistance protein